MSELTGFDRRKVRRRLETLEPEKKGRSYLCNSHEALRLLYGDGGDGKLDPQQERAALDRARREAVEMDNKRKSGELVPVDEVTEAWGKLVTNTRAKLLGLPTRLAPRLLSQREMRDIERTLKDAIYECLQALSETDPDEIAP